MTKPQFTEGPWAASYFHSDTHGEGKIKDCCENILAIVTGSNYSVYFGGFNGDWSSPNVEEEDAKIHEANAHLIAAAPDLYKALDDMVKWLDSEDDIEDQKINAIAALAKARGEQ